MTYRLENFENVHRQQPKDFCIPRLEERLALQPGEHVLLGLVSETSNAQGPEPAWVRIEQVRQQSKYVGILLENPQTVQALRAGYRLDFGPENVAEIFVEEGGYRWIDEGKLSMVAATIIQENGWPGKLMRIPPMDQEYSGWFIMTGSEGSQYMRNMGNFTPIRLSEVVRRYPIMRSVLFAPVGTEWQWDGEALEYRTPAAKPKPIIP